MISFVCIATAVIGAYPAPYERINVSLDFGIESADRIAIGKVREIRSHGNLTIATLDVEQVLKGSPTKHLEFRTSPSWPCDESHGKIGERLLLVTERSDPRMLRWPDVSEDEKKVFAKVASINNDGAGRFVIQKGRIEMRRYEDRLSHVYFDFPVGFPYKPLAKDRASISERDLISYIRQKLSKPKKRLYG